MRHVTANPPDGDELLIARYSRGDAAALDELFCRYRELAYRVAYRLLGHPEDARDAVQEGFIKALRRLRSFEGRCSFKTWLLRVVSNAALDLGRQRRRRELLNATAAERYASGDSPSPEQADPGQAVDEADLRAALAEALLRLSEGQRRTFVLHVDGGLSYREVADALGISIGTVMSRLFYARQRLKDLLSARAEP